MAREKNINSNKNEYKIILTDNLQLLITSNNYKPYNQK
jgi:hypothetical protein